MSDEFREWIIDFGDSGYVVRYRIDPNAVTILAVYLPSRSSRNSDDGAVPVTNSRSRARVQAT